MTKEQTRRDMSRKFLKRSGKSFKQNGDLKVSNNAFLILKENKNSAGQIKQIKDKTYLLGFFDLVSKKCLDYYLSPKTRDKFSIGSGSFKEKPLPSSRNTAVAIARKYFPNAENMDYLVFYGYDLYLVGNSRIKAKEIENLLRWHVKEKFRTLEKKRAIRESKTLYDYKKIDFFGVKFNAFNAKLKDFYYAIGDGNYLFGNVCDVNPILRTFSIMYVYFDEYNWGDNDTYFFKSNKNPDSPFTAVIETAAFKKFESEGLAKPFLTFFVDTQTYFY